MAEPLDRQPVHEVPVLIVGAGPAGLTAGITLGRYGVQSLIIERRREVSHMPRATAISTRSMELFRSWGLEEDIRAGAPEVEWLGWSSYALTGTTGAAFPVGFPTREQSALISPTTPACVSQADLEPVLLRHLSSLRTSRLERGTTLESVQITPDGVEAQAHGPSTGQTTTIRARYVIAADGVRSTVRRAMGIRLRGAGRLAERIGVQFRTPLWSLLGERRYAIYSIENSDGGATFIPSGRGDRWIYARSCHTVVKTVTRKINRHRRRTHVSQQRCSTRALTGTITLTTASARAAATITRGRTTYATGTGVNLGRGGLLLLVRDHHALTPGHYSVSVHGRPNSSRMAITIA